MNNFEQIGKKTTYKVPEGFFDQLPEKTLAKARLRERKARQKITLWISMAAASVVVVMMLVWPGNDQVTPSKIPPLAENIKTDQPEPGKATSSGVHYTATGVTQPVTEGATTVKMQSMVADSIKDKLVDPASTADLSTANHEPDENIEDLLGKLSDEEVLQMAAIYESDLFIDETNE